MNKRLAQIKGGAFISVKEAAQKLGYTPEFITWLCRKGRVKGAYRVGHAWAIPERWRYVKRRRGGKHGPSKVKPVFALEDPSLKMGLPSRTHPSEDTEVIDNPGNIY